MLLSADSQINSGDSTIKFSPYTSSRIIGNIQPKDYRQPLLQIL